MRHRAAACRAGTLAGAILLLIAQPHVAAAQPWLARQIAAADSLRRSGKGDEGALLARGILDRLRAESDTTSLRFADASDLLARCLLNAGKGAAPECKASASRAIALRERLQGEASVDLARSVSVLASATESAGAYEPALALWERSLSIAQSAAAGDSIVLAETLVGVANLRARLGRYAGLAGMYERAASIQEGVLGPDDPAIANTLKNHAILAKLTGDFAKSRVLYERVLAIEGRRYPSSARALGTTYHNYANLLTQLGEFAAAEAAYLRAIEVRIEARGADHQDVAQSRMGLALVFRDRGDALAARESAEAALAGLRKSLGPEHPQTASAEATLAEILVHLGDLQAAEDTAEHALSITQATVGPEHPRVASLHVLLGHIHWTQGEFDAGEEHFRRAIAIREGIQGADPLELAKTLSGFSLDELDIGKRDAAAPLVARAMDICRATGNETHVVMAPLLISSARLAIGRGDPDSAMRAVARAGEIMDARMGRGSPHRHLLALTEAAALRGSGAPVGAVGAALESERISRETVRWTVQGLTEKQALAYIQTGRSGLDLALSIATESPLPDSVNRSIWDSVTRSRGLVLDEMIARRRSLRAGADAGTRALRDQLTSACRELSWLVSTTREEEASERARARFDSAFAERERLERELAARSRPFATERRAFEVGFEDVARALPDGSALVAYVRYVHIPPGEIPALQGVVGPLEAPSYAVLVATADRSRVVVRPLGPAAEIDALVRSWRDEVELGARVPGRSAAQAETACRDAGRRLRARIWDPLADPLRGAERIVLVPDGALHLVNFDALPAEGGSSYLVEGTAQLERISLEREIVDDSARSSRAGGGLLALGDPDFDADLADLRSPGPADSARSEQGNLALERGAIASSGARTQGAVRRSDCDRLRSAVFPRLPHSGDEIREIADLWDAEAPHDRATRLTGRMASEDAWRENAGSARALHIATHGFFIDGSCRQPNDATRGIVGVGPSGGTVSDRSHPPVLANDPLLLSGFALAGANTRNRSGSEQEDGIVTAEEIAELDLDRVEWAVLSTCESALGEIRSGEGVLGLHRAFRLAGAGTVVMSLWSIQDQATEDWMRAYYTARLQEGLATSAAVRRAELGLLARLREKGAGTHPFYWAGFIASGVDR